MNAARKLDKLVHETEELLESIAHENAPQIDDARERLQESLERTKSAIRAERKDGRGGHVKVRDLAGSLNDYVQRFPWLALATGVLVASSVGILATSATKRSYRHGMSRNVGT
jgi:ElaB/YqjD/DUF883 family membrane-anchored ribosome-binding protein